VEKRLRTTALESLNSSLAQSDGELLPGEKCPSE